MTVCLVDALLLTSCCCSSSDQILVVLAQDQSSHSPGCSGVVGAGPAKAMVHHAAVLRLQAVGDVLLHLLTAPQEPAAIPSQLLPWAPPVLLLLSTDEDLVHVVREAYLRVRPESTCKPRAGQLLQGGATKQQPQTHHWGKNSLVASAGPPELIHVPQRRLLSCADAGGSQAFRLPWQKIPIPSNL